MLLVSAEISPSVLPDFNPDQLEHHLRTLIERRYAQFGITQPEYDLQIL